MLENCSKQSFIASTCDTMLTILLTLGSARIQYIGPGISNLRTNARHDAVTCRANDASTRDRLSAVYSPIGSFSMLSMKPRELPKTTFCAAHRKKLALSLPSSVLSSVITLNKVSRPVREAILPASHLFDDHSYIISERWRSKRMLNSIRNSQSIFISLINSINKKLQINSYN